MSSWGWSGSPLRTKKYGTGIEWILAGMTSGVATDFRGCCYHLFSRNLKIEVVEDAASQEPPCHLSPFLFSSIAQEQYLFYYKSGDQE